MKKIYEILNESFAAKANPLMEECTACEHFKNIFEMEFDEDVVNQARVNEENNKEAYKDTAVSEALEVPQDVEMMTIDELLSNMHQNISEESMDQQIKLFRGIAKILGVKRYEDVIVAINYGEYDPKYLMQDGYPVDLGTEIVTHYPSENIVVENIDSNLYLYFVTERSCNNYFALANKFLNDYDIDPTYVEDTAEPERIEIPRVDDEFKWSL